MEEGDEVESKWRATKRQILKRTTENPISWSGWVRLMWGGRCGVCSETSALKLFLKTTMRETRNTH